MQGTVSIRTVPALVLALGLGVLAGPSSAADDLDALAAFAAIDEAELSSLSGRQGISVSDQDLAAIAQGGVFVAGEGIETGVVNFGNSMQHMRGVNNQAINTGNNASVNAGLTVQIHLY